MTKHPQGARSADFVDVPQSIASSSTSVADSIRQFRIENGRTYHSYKDGKYYVPNDAREIDRLDVQHNMFILSFDGRLGTAPPNAEAFKVGRVLDVGTGSGIWAMEFGEEHPDAEVLGFDLSATLPEFTPPNVRFEVDDLEEDWNYSRPFDYIHSRMMTSSVGDWNVYVKKCFDNLNPGGYLELNEIDLYPCCDDGSLKEDSPMYKCVRLWGEAAEIFGRPFINIKGLKDVLLDVGFEDVHIQRFKWPNNPWPKDKKHKELGYWNYDNFATGIEGFLMAPLTRALNWTPEEVTVFSMEVRREFKDPRVHSYSSISSWSIYGRKPEEAKTPDEDENASVRGDVSAHLSLNTSKREDLLTTLLKSIASSSTSVSDSVYRFRVENGRTYHNYKDGRRVTDSVCAPALSAVDLGILVSKSDISADVQHNMFLLTFDNKLGTAPPNWKDSKIRVGQVLDVGTGTGIWAEEFGEEHPESEVLGVDLSAIQPEYTHPNVRFEIDDIEDPWIYSKPFDYIHSRMMQSSIADWQEYVKKCYNNLSPGGYLEMNEMGINPRSDDGTLLTDSALMKFSMLWAEASAKFGRPWQDPTTLKHLMAKAGFIDIHEQSFKWPSNPWASDKKHKELGYWNLDNAIAGLEGFMLAPLTRVLNWSPEEVTVLAMEVRREMKDPSIHSYSTIVTDSVYQFRLENGRTYHKYKDGKYSYPNDAGENDRLGTFSKLLI
ncbi:Trans-aconitate 2-methyltransferase 10 [Colletotrichum chlorophyti]|uniref:Trans-aconitate 2-methyltransferase 10 n=1 Tax=Colletotrichum chlorophyti TaxID=708187 RepID=A0A1Q8RTD9_9PEZI|nr:Trans-aconitate 2-methyltransferase 10 [Colletotrichum chlorophyti]